MAYVISRQTGNWQTAGTWGPTITGTENLTTFYATGIALTTSYVVGTTFTIGAGAVCDGILLCLYRATATAGTISAALYKTGALVTGCEVTIDVATLANDNTHYTYVFFKFDSPHTAAGGSDYAVALKNSIGATSVYSARSTSAASPPAFHRAIRGDGTGVPAAADLVYVVGQQANGGQTAVTVTYDCTSDVALNALEIQTGGTLRCANQPSTAYLLKVANNISLKQGGVLEVGTQETPLDSSSTFTLTMQLASSGQFGIYVYANATLRLRGATRTYDRAMLAADANSGTGTLTTDVSTGWLNGDVIGLASSGAVVGQSETFTLTQGASGTTITLPSNLANTHTGSAPFQSEVVLLTRNIKVQTSNAAYYTFAYVTANATVDVGWVQFVTWGTGAANKYGWYLMTTTGSALVERCAFQNCQGYLVDFGANCANASFKYNVGYNIVTASYYVAILAATINGACEFTYNTFLNCTGHGFDFEGSCQIHHNTVAGYGATGNAFYVNDTSPDWTLFHDNLAHSGGYALVLAAVTSGQDFNGPFTYWNVVSGVRVTAIKTLPDYSGIAGYGASSEHYYFSAALYGIEVASCTAGNTAACPNGKLVSFATANVPYIDVVFEGCDFRPSASGATAVGGLATYLAASYGQLTFRNCKLTSDLATIATGLTGARPRSYVVVEQWDQTAGYHAYLTPEGALTRDTARYATASPGERLYGVNGVGVGGNYFESSPRQVAIAAGAVATFSVKVRRSDSSSGDAASYAGSQPELVVRKNYDAGFASDQLLDTGASAVGQWETLTGTLAAVAHDCVLEAFVRIKNNSTTQFVTLDDWEVSLA